jgi:hypothetical protein
MVSLLQKKKKENEEVSIAAIEKYIENVQKGEEGLQATWGCRKSKEPKGKGHLNHKKKKKRINYQPPIWKGRRGI